MNRKTYLLALLVIGAILFVGFRSVRMPGRGDAVSLYYGSRVLLEGHNPYRLPNLAAAWHKDGSPEPFRPDMMERVFITPPAICLLLAPVVLLPPALGIPGMSFYNFLGVLICLACFYGLLKGRRKHHEILLIAAYILCQRPLLAVLQNGQATMVICALLAGMLLLLERKRDVPAGILLGLALTKFTLSLPFLALLLYRRRWRPALTALAVCVSLNLMLALPWGVTHLLPDYRAAIISTTGPGSPQDPSHIYRFDMIHAERLLYSILGAERHGIVKILHLLIVVASLAALLVLWRPSAKSENGSLPPLDIALAMMAGLFLFYHRYYDLASLMFVAYGLAEYAWQHNRPLPLPWKFCFVLLLLLSFGTSATGWSILFDRQLVSIGLPTTPYYNAPLVALLFAALVWLAFYEQNHKKTVSSSQRSEQTPILEKA